MVARTVPPKEVKVNKKAQEAMDKEWASLREIGAWNEKGVREWTDVKKEAKRHETRVHVGMVFGICVEKGSELAPDDPKRKYKGRVVFRGNDVRDEENYLATFQDMGSAPASMASGKFLDFIGMQEGWQITQADAVRAYTQALLKGTKTWVRLPKDRWPKGWQGFKDPVCPLVLALYGHPDAGSNWEEHCDAKVASIGFKPIPNWPGCYVHGKLRALLTVYVDDFKLAAHKNDEKAVWKALQTQLVLEPPTPLALHLGCLHHQMDMVLVDPTITLGRKVPLLATACAGGNGAESTVKAAPTVRVLRYDMSQFVSQCVEAYQKLAGENAKPLSTVNTPFLDEQTIWQPPSGPPTGILANVALKVLMKILYVARMARSDILRATCMLARRVAHWCPDCDRRLHRLVCYMHSTRNLQQHAYVGESMSNCRLALFADADFAGDKSDSKSTSGIFIAAVGAKTCVPLIAISKKQGCVSTSTCESEVVAMVLGVKEALPVVDFWDAVQHMFRKGKTLPDPRPGFSLDSDAGGTVVHDTEVVVSSKTKQTPGLHQS
jgi:hypothetical protein